MAYKIVHKTRGTSVSNPAVCVTKDFIRFNAAARKAFGIDGYTHAELYQDDEAANLHSVKLLTADAEHAKQMKEGGISAKEWNNTINLPSGVFPVSFDQGNALLEFDTDNALPARKSKGELKDAKPRPMKKAA